jgi:colanic acid biosynthesis glycosyl transferase WcaI
MQGSFPGRKYFRYTENSYISMRILLLANYYAPEEVGAGIWIRQLALDLQTRGHEVQALVSFPNYPNGEIFKDYRGRIHMREEMEGISLLRTWTVATKSKSFWPRFAAFGSFCASSLVMGAWEWLCGRLQADAVYVVMPPLPLGVTGWLLAKLCRARLVTNVQDIYPDIAVESGYLHNTKAISFFRAMERWIYRQSSAIVVISDGFRRNLLGKNVPEHKMHVVANWADTREIAPMDRDTEFRRSLRIGDKFLLLYSGGLSLNSCLEPVLDAAALLPPEQFEFVFVGNGARKEFLEQRAQEMKLSNVRFLPFQPLDQYARTLASADATLVTLSEAATFASVPSKIFKQMAAGRAIVAITNNGNELERLVRKSDSGMVVPLQPPEKLAKALLFLRDNPELCRRMGENGRHYLEKECSRELCVGRIEEVLTTI